MEFILSVKSYGDFVIACNAMNVVRENKYKIIASLHLKSLYYAIDFSGDMIWFDLNDCSVPALYDVHKRGIDRALVSFRKLKAKLNQLVTTDDTLVFDRIGLRERFLSFGLKSKEVYIGRNIYLDYDIFICRNSLVHNIKYKPPEVVGVFPDSRLEEKKIPVSVVKRIIQILSSYRVAVKVIVVDELFSNAIVDSEKINGLDVLVNKVRSCDLVISADSLPAHLAEYFSIPNYILTKEYNKYWLPKSSYLKNSYSLFEDVEYLNSWIKKTYD